jgi:hypothetical protein
MWVATPLMLIAASRAMTGPAFPSCVLNDARVEAMGQKRQKKGVLGAGEGNRNN